MKLPKIKLSQYVNKATIASAFVGFILTFLFSKAFDPICESIYSFILRVGDYFIVSFSNSTYREIALGLTEQASYSLLYFIYLVLVLFFKFIMDSIDKDIYSNLTEDERKINTWKHLEKNSHDEKQITPSENALHAFEAQLTNRRKYFKRARIFLTILIYVLLFVIIMMNARQTFIHKKTITAINNIEIVAPYISDLQYKQFKSDFYMIQNKQDYDALLTSIKAIASQENILLPKQQFYDFP